MKNYLKTFRLMTALLIIPAAVIFSSCAAPTVSPEPTAKSQPSPTIVLTPPVNAIDTKTRVTILGSGFEPGQELHLLLTVQDGISNEIGDYLTPKPVVADRSGNWAVVFDCKNFVSGERITMGEGVHTITVADAGYKKLAQAPVAFYDPKKPAEQWTSWAKLFGKPPEPTK